MKTIKLLKKENEMPSVVLLKTVLENPQKGANVQSIRMRCKLTDKLDLATGDTLTLEDAEYEFLTTTINEFTFGMSNNQVLAIIDATLTPIEPPKEQGTGNGDSNA